MEEWKQLKNYPDYLVSDKGRVKSFKYLKSKILKSHSNKVKRSLESPYMRLILRLDGKSVNKYIHRLVAETFIGEIPKTHQVDHIDNNTVNNNLSNLRIITIAENAGKKGENNIKSKLSNKDVLEIRKKALKKGRQGNIHEIANAYNVTEGTIYHVLRNKTWTHI